MSDSDGYEAWDEKYADELLHLYHIFQNYGELVFGAAFHQLGNLDMFATYVQDTTLLEA